MPCSMFANDILGSNADGGILIVGRFDMMMVSVRVRPSSKDISAKKHSKDLCLVEQDGRYR
jgi:hypothetical protein